VFSCNSFGDFCVSSLRASTCLLVFSYISLREFFMPFLKFSIIIKNVILNRNLAFLVCLDIQYFLWWENWALMMPCSLGSCCLGSCACLSPSGCLWCYFVQLFLTVGLTVPIGLCVSSAVDLYSCFLSASNGNRVFCFQMCSHSCPLAFSCSCGHVS